MAIADYPVGTVTLKSTYAEPTIMWRLRYSDDGGRAFSVIVPVGSRATAIWYSRDVLQESRDFATWHEALYWLEKTRLTLRLSGWDREDLSDQQPAPDQAC